MPPAPEASGDDAKTTNTAAYAAVDAKISARFALVNTATLMANSTMNMAIRPIKIFSSFTIRSTTIAPNKRAAALNVLIMAAAQVT